MTDPNTCWHNILAPVVLPDFKLYVECASCGTDMTDPLDRAGKNYEYDIDANVWVHVPRKKER